MPRHRVLMLLFLCGSALLGYITFLLFDDLASIVFEILIVMSVASFVEIMASLKQSSLGIAS